MPDRYHFDIVIDDSGDEFSENFNPKDEKQVRQFERDIENCLEEAGWNTHSVTLRKVVTEL